MALSCAFSASLHPPLRCCRYKNLDKLIHYANLDGRVNAFYSTPAAYTDAKNSYQEPWPVKTDDFFPYADCMTCYWTGEICVPVPHDWSPRTVILRFATTRLRTTPRIRLLHFALLQSSMVGQ